MFHTRSKECTVFFLHRIYLEVERHQDGFVSLRKLQFGMDDSFIEVLTLLHVMFRPRIERIWQGINGFVVKQPANYRYRSFNLRVVFHVRSLEGIVNTSCSPSCTHKIE